MNIFRSEDMLFCQLFCQPSATYSVVAEMGEVGLMQFKDLNAEVNAFSRKFVNEIRRCEELERQIRYFQRELAADKIKARELQSLPQAPNEGALGDVETELTAYEGMLRASSSTLTQLEQNRQELAEMREVLIHFDQLMNEASSNKDIEMNNMGTIEQGRKYTAIKTGVLPFRRLPGFMRTLFYVCYSQVLVKWAELDPATIGLPPDAEKKAAFIVFYQGQQIELKVDKIIASYSGSQYSIPDERNERQKMKLDLAKRIADMDTVVTHSQTERNDTLHKVARHLNEWQIQVLKAKAVYHTMNMFNTSGSTYFAECWLPAKEFSTIQMMFNNISRSEGVASSAVLHPVPTNDTPPTHFQLNKFTGSFQSIIDAYGFANYKEVNPALFAIITFPFLFGVMFGDLAHGLIMLLFAAWMVIWERKVEKMAKTSDIFSMIFGGRYLILMMGMFSVYAGLLYNECFAKSVNIFGSHWTVIYDDPYLTKTDFVMLDPNDTRVWKPDPYPFGMDPIWAQASNKISFTNSYKEKLSVILGISQMTLGVLLSLSNHFHRKSLLDVFCCFIPELMFLMCMFGYLVALIFTKWIKYAADDASCAPSLLVGYINMFLASYPDDPCYTTTWYPGQKLLQMILVGLCLISAVWLMLAKPLVLRHRHRQQFGHQTLQEDEFTDVASARASSPRTPSPRPSTSTDDQLTESPDHHHVQSVDTFPVQETNGSVTSMELDKEITPSSEPEFQFSELMIHQTIHTIEFCLGCISHTASYLRLWALSLAHSQLAEVLWNMVLRIGLKIPGFFGSGMIFAIFPAFAWLTIGILLVMEGLSAFLHTIRLHWIEFQTKFYKGEGIPFLPFSFKTVLENLEENN